MVHNLGHAVTVQITGLSGYVVTNYTSMPKEMMMRSVYLKYDTEDGKIGGPGHIVEIDETKIATRKNGVGNILARQLEWVFGGIDRVTKQSFKCRVEARGIRNLIPVLKRFVRPGTTIVSDGWSAYSGIGQVPGMNWTHKWVNHTENFVIAHDVIVGSQADHQEEQVHTYTIERHWRDVKNMVRVYSDRDGAVDRELAVHTYVSKTFGRGSNAIRVSARVKKLI